jgi:hypothetical protein
MDAYKRSVPTARAGLMWKNKTRIGVMSDPPPTPVKPTSRPTKNPENIKPISIQP